MNSLCDVHGQHDSQVNRDNRGLDPPVAISGFHHLPMHGTADGSRLQRDESQNRHGCFFARFTIIDFSSLRTEMHIMAMSGCRILPNPLNLPVLESFFPTHMGHRARFKSLLSLPTSSVRSLHLQW